VGYQEGEIRANPEEWFHHRIHDADPTSKRRLPRHQHGLTPHFEIDPAAHKEWQLSWMRARGAVHHASGNFLRMAGSQTDITEGKVSDPTGLAIGCCLFTGSRLVKHHEAPLDHFVWRSLSGP